MIRDKTVVSTVGSLDIFQKSVQTEVKENMNKEEESMKEEKETKENHTKENSAEDTRIETDKDSQDIDHVQIHTIEKEIGPEKNKDLETETDKVEIGIDNEDRDLKTIGDPEVDNTNIADHHMKIKV